MAHDSDDPRDAVVPVLIFKVFQACFPVQVAYIYIYIYIYPSWTVYPTPLWSWDTLLWTIGGDSHGVGPTLERRAGTLGVPGHAAHDADGTDGQNWTQRRTVKDCRSDTELGVAPKPNWRAQEVRSQWSMSQDMSVMDFVFRHAELKQYTVHLNF